MMLGQNSHNTFPINGFYHQMLNAISLESSHHENAEDISWDDRGNQPMMIDFISPTSELPNQVINFNEEYTNDSGDLQVDGESGPSHFQIFGRRVLITTNGPAWDDHQQRDITHIAQNENEQINSGSLHFQIFGRRVLITPNGPAWDEHQQNDVTRAAENQSEQMNSGSSHIQIFGRRVLITPNGPAWDKHQQNDVTHGAENQSEQMNSGSSHIQIFGRRVLITPSGPAWDDHLQRDVTHSAENQNQQISFAEGTFTLGRYLSESSSGITNDNLMNERHRRFETSANGGVFIQETSSIASQVDGTSRWAGNFVEGSRRYNENSNVHVQPFVPEMQETFAGGENFIVQEDHIEGGDDDEDNDDYDDDAHRDNGNDDVGGDVMMDVNANENPFQMDEAREEALHGIIDYAALVEDFSDGDYDEEFDRLIDNMDIDVENMSYEELMALARNIDDMANVNAGVSNDSGLSEEEIGLRIKWYRDITFFASTPHEGDVCIICLDGYAKGQDIGELDCHHKFHHSCIKNWLRQKNACPLCRSAGMA